jgi:Ser/Thr protein kinase RdoA (MazF antagonist)
VNPEDNVTQVLNAYGLETASITTLRHLGNYVAKVEHEGQTFGLRICVPETKPERLQVELEWLEALSRDTPLSVPQPIKNKEGEFVTKLSDRHALVFTWVEGEPVSRHISVSVAAQIGELMATLHEHAHRYQPKHYVGPVYDAEWLNGEQSWWKTRAITDIGIEDFIQLSPAIDGLSKRMNALRNSKHFGLIHSDLHFGNILLSNGKTNVIDFDGCALGFYAFDIAVTENEFMDYDNGKELVAAFRKAYETKTGQQVSKDADLFRIASNVVFLEWVFTSPNPKVREEKMAWVESTLKTIRETGRHF